MTDEAFNMDLLEKEDFAVVMSFMKNTLKVCSEEEFHKLISDFALYFGYEYVIYGYMKSIYSKKNEPCIVNISNPKEWAAEYDEKGYYNCDPVMVEVELREQKEIKDNFILWDSYDRELSVKEHEVIGRRKHYGLNFGFSIYENSLNKDFAFIIEFASYENEVVSYMPAVMDNVISHLSAARKKLDILQLLNLLTEREFAVAEHLAMGRASCEIASELAISEATVKFHLTNIYSKLGVTKRQEAISLLLTARYLCITE